VAFSLAHEAASRLPDDRSQAEALSGIAQSQARVGEFAQISQTVERIRVGRNDHLPAIAAILTQVAPASAEARAAFLALLPDCSLDLDAAIRMCGHLATLYPTCAADIAGLLRQLPVHTPALVPAE